MPVASPDYWVFRESIATPLAPEAFEYSLSRWISQIPEEEGLVRQIYVPLITDTCHLISDRSDWRPAEVYFWDSWYWSRFFSGNGNATFYDSAKRFTILDETFSLKWLEWYEVYKSIEGRHPRFGLTVLLTLISETDCDDYPKRREFISRWLASEDAKPPFEERTIPLPPDFKDRVRLVFDKVGDWWPLAPTRS